MHPDPHARFQIRSLAEFAVTGDLGVRIQGAGMLLLAFHVGHHELVAGDADYLAIVTARRERRILVERFDSGRRVRGRVVRRHPNLHPRLEVCGRACLTVAGHCDLGSQRVTMFLSFLVGHRQFVSADADHRAIHSLLTRLRDPVLDLVTQVFD